MSNEKWNTPIEQALGVEIEVYDRQDDYPDPTEGARAILICVTADQNPKVFQDNVHANCEHCGVEIVHRPHVPKGCIKLCNDCALKDVEKAKASGETEFKMAISRQTHQEVLEWVKKQKPSSR